MFPNKSETLCDRFHKLKQNTFFDIDVHVPISITTKPKLYFENLPKFKGTNCLLR